MYAIEIQGLEKAYQVGFWRKRRKVALRPLFLTVEPGQIFGLLGPNGAGKTTTLKMLMGLVYPTSGSARILGMQLGDARMKAQIGFLPEQPYFYDYLTAHELLCYYGHLSGLGAKQLATRVDSLVDQVGLRDAANLQLRKFSKGMLQRVGIAQAILHDPKVVFLDEPMSGLDPMGRFEVRRLIEDLKSQGKTVFFSTHILSDAEALCDRVAVLHLGELRGVAVVSEITARVHGKVEILWEGSAVPAAIRGLGVDYRLAGHTVRVVVPEERQDYVLEILRREHLRLLSVAPVRMSLEDYFVTQVGQHNLGGATAGVTPCSLAGASKA